MPKCTFIAVTVDDHDGQGRRLAEGGSQTAIDQLTMKAQTGANIAAERDPLGNPPTLHLTGEDGVCYADFHPAGSNVCPLELDGTSAVGADSRYATSKDDTDILTYNRLVYAGFPCHTIPEHIGFGNHETQYWHFNGANNDAVSDIAADVMTSVQELTGYPSSVATTPADDAVIWSTDPLARYGARIHGHILICWGSPYIASQYGTSNGVELPSPLPGVMQDVHDWTWGIDQIDFFFHPTNGLLRNWRATTGCRWCIFKQHHNAGGDTAGTQGIYGRSGDASTRLGEHWGDFGTDPYGYTGSAPWYISAGGTHALFAELIGGDGCEIAGHDHIGNVQTVDGFTYIVLPTPGSPSGFPDTYGDLQTYTGPGYATVLATSKSMTVRAKRTWVDGLSLGEVDNMVNASELFTVRFGEFGYSHWSPANTLFGFGVVR